MALPASRALLLPRFLIVVIERVFLSQDSATLPLNPALCPSFDVGPDPETKCARVQENWAPPHGEELVVQEEDVIDGITDALHYFAAALLAGGSSRRALPPRGGRRAADGAAAGGIGNSVYLLRFHRLLFESVDGMEMPAASTIAYIPPAQPAIVFNLDPETGAFIPTQLTIQVCLATCPLSQ